MELFEPLAFVGSVALIALAIYAYLSRRTCVHKWEEHERLVTPSTVLYVQKCKHCARIRFFRVFG